MNMLIALMFILSQALITYGGQQADWTNSYNHSNVDGFSLLVEDVATDNNFTQDQESHNHETAIDSRREHSLERDLEGEQKVTNNAVSSPNSKNQENIQQKIDGEQSRLTSSKQGTLEYITIDDKVEMSFAARAMINHEGLGYLFSIHHNEGPEKEALYSWVYHILNNLGEHYARTSSLELKTILRDAAKLCATAHALIDQGQFKKASEVIMLCYSISLKLDRYREIAHNKFYYSDKNCNRAFHFHVYEQFIGMRHSTNQTFSQLQNITKFIMKGNRPGHVNNLSSHTSQVNQLTGIIVKMSEKEWQKVFKQASLAIGEKTESDLANSPLMECTPAALKPIRQVTGLPAMVKNYHNTVPLEQHELPHNNTLAFEAESNQARIMRTRPDIQASDLKPKNDDKLIYYTTVIDSTSTEQILAQAESILRSEETKRDLIALRNNYYQVLAQGRPIPEQYAHRMNAIDNYVDSNNLNKQLVYYNLDESVRTMLDSYSVSQDLFNVNIGTYIQQQVHSELIGILQYASQLNNEQDLQSLLVSGAVTGQELNRSGHVPAAYGIADFCYSSMLLGKGVIKGAALGIKEVAVGIKDLVMFAGFAIAHPMDTGSMIKHGLSECKNQAARLAEWSQRVSAYYAELDRLSELPIEEAGEEIAAIQAKLDTEYEPIRSSIYSIVNSVQNLDAESAGQLIGKTVVEMYAWGKATKFLKQGTAYSIKQFGKLTQKHARAKLVLDMQKMAASIGKKLASKPKAPKLIPLGRGSTGRNTPKNLLEQLVLEEIMADPSKGKFIKIVKGMTDPRWPKEDGWKKMTFFFEDIIYGEKKEIRIHFVAQFENSKIIAIDDFKFKKNTFF